MSDQPEPQRLIVGTVCDECGQITVPPQIIPGEGGEVKVCLFERCCVRCHPQRATKARASVVAWLDSAWFMAAVLWVIGCVLIWLIYHPKG